MEGYVNSLTPLALMGWFPATLAFFVLFPACRAVTVSFIAGWMFLPVIEYKIAAFPPFDKTAVISLAVLLGVLLFDTGRLLRFRPRWLDIPMLVVCLCPMGSSLSNDLGPGDGLTESLKETMLWGLPWLIGRLYFTEPKALRELAVGLFVGGLVYAPLCLWEIRMSPQLHYQMYGFHQHSVFQHMRYGGWRPMVFMQHGLMVGLFMTAATLSGLWLDRSGSLKTLFGIPLPVFAITLFDSPRSRNHHGFELRLPVLVIALFATTLLIKSVGAILLLLAGVGVLYCVQYLRSSLPVLALAAVAVAYVLVRMTGAISSNDLVAAADAALGAERAQSLESRLTNEDMLTVRALQQPLFGWGGWGRARIHDEWGQDITITDSLWIIVLGNKGLVGLTGLLLALLLPTLLFPRHVPARLWGEAEAGACAVLAVILLLWTVDNLLNAMINPIYLLIAGGLGAFEITEPATESEPDSVAEYGPKPVSADNRRWQGTSVES